jgi:hypothetical protein
MRGLIALALALLTRTAGGQAPAVGVFTGAVFSDLTREAMADVEVALPELQMRTRTDTYGVFRLTDIPRGKYLVAVRQMGYAAVTATFAFAGGDTVRHLFLLSKAVRLDSVTVTARRSEIPGFEERRVKHIGHFITREELEKAGDKRMADVLSQVPGLRVVRTKPTEAIATSSRGRVTLMASNPSCLVQIYIDGTAISTEPPAPPFNLNTLTPGEMEGVEYYVGGAQQPPEYRRTGSACGALLFWTRRR